MKRAISLAALLAVMALLVASCATKDKCTADTDCAAGYTCGEDDQCHKLEVTLSFPDITEGQRFTVADDADKSDATIQLPVVVTATATSGTLRDGAPLTLTVTYPAGEATDDDTLTPRSTAKSISYTGILVSGRAQFLGVPFPEEGSYTLTAYLAEHPQFTTSVSVTVDYAVAQTLVMRYYKGGTTPMVLEGASLDDNDDLDKDTGGFQVKMEAVTTGHPDGTLVQLYIDTETPALVGEATIQSDIASFPSVTVPIRTDIVMRVKAGAFEDTLTFDAVTANQCTFTLNLKNNQRFGIADDEDSVSGLQKTLVIGDIATCSTGSTVEIYVDRTPGTDTPTITTSLGGATLERQITLPESADKEDTHTLIVVMKDDDTSATGQATVTGLFVDLTPPTIEVTSPLANAVFFPTDDTNETLDGLQIEVAGTTGDALSDTIDVGVYYDDLLRGEFSGLGEFTIEDITFLQTDEAAELTITARDAVGNETSVTIPITVYVNEPTIAFQTICGRVPTMHMQLSNADDTDGEAAGLQCAVIVRTNNLASDTTEVSLTVNDGETMTTPIEAGGLATFDLVTLPEGEVSLFASVTNAGEEHSSQITVDVDSVAPIVSFSQTPTVEGGLVNSRNASFTLACSESNCSFRVNLDDGGWSDYTNDTVFAFTNLGDGDHTLEAQAHDAFGNESTVIAFHWAVDATAPVAPVVSGDTPTTDTTPTWTWNAVGDAVEYRWSFDETNWTTTADTAYTPDSPIGEGDHTLFVQARDAAGNWSESGSFTITIDTIAPEAPVVTGNTPTNDTTPTWTWEPVAEADKYRWSFDGTNWTTTSDTSYTPDTPLDEGNHTLFVQARDLAGNWSESGSFTITVDLTSPAKPVVSGQTPTTDTTPTWDWISSPDAVEYRYSFVDGANWAYTTDTSYTPGAPLGEGDHTLFVQARDAAGNWSESGSKTITIDLSAPDAPVVTGTTPTNDTTPTWSWGAVAGAVEYRYSFTDGSGWTTTTNTSFTPSSPLNEGNHTLFVQARNDLGTWSGSGYFTITVDLTAPAAPTVTGITPTNNTQPTWSWNIPVGTVEFRYSDDETNWTVTDATSHTPGNPLIDGDHTLFVQGRDAAGNWSASGFFTITVDTDGPTIGIGAPSVTVAKNGTDVIYTVTYGGADSVTLAAGDITLNKTGTASGTVAVSGSGTGSRTVTISNLTGDGTLGISIAAGTASDSAGNTAPAAGPSTSFTVDNTAPAAPTVNGTTPTNDTTPTWTWNTPAGTVEFRYSFTDGSGWTTTTNTSFTPSSPLSETTHTLYVQGRDAAGNWSASGSFTITIDLTAPVISFDPVPPCTRRTTGTITFTVTGDPVTITCTFNTPSGPGTPTPCTTSYAYTLDGGDGDYTLTVTATDAAGNSDSETSASIDLDSTTPSFSWWLPANGTSYKYGSSVPTFVIRTKNLEAGETVEIIDNDTGLPVGSLDTAGSLCNATEDISIPIDLPDKCTPYVLYARVNDGVVPIDRYTDNKTTLPATTRSFTIDRNRPVIDTFVVTNDANGDDALVAIEDLDGNSLNGMQATIVLTIHDDIDIGRTMTLRNQTTGSLYTATVAGDRTATFTSITIPEGGNSFSATLTDCNGNVSAASTKLITVDTTPPSVLFQGPNGTTPGHALWLTARDGIVNGDDELTGQILKFKITGDWNGATPTVKHIVYDYADFDELGSYTYTAGEMTIAGTEVTIDLDASSDPFTPLAYNRHKFEVTVQDAHGNTRVASRLYEVDPIIPNADIAYPTSALVLDDTKDEDLSISGVQFTLKLDLSKLATPTGTSSTIDITAIPITAIGGTEDTTRQRKSWNGFTATNDGANQTFPNDGSFLRVGDGFWRLMVTVTDDHLNVFESGTVDVEVDTDVACFSLYLANDKLINGRQVAPTWLNTNDGSGTYDMYVLTDAPNGSTATLLVNGTTTYGPATVTDGRADFAVVTLLTGGVENTLALTVNNGVMPATDTYYVRADVTDPSLDAGDMNPAPYVTGTTWEIGYGYDDDTNHDTTNILELTASSPNRIIFVIGGIEDIAGYTIHGTVMLTAVSPVGAIGGTTTAYIVEDGADMVAEFTNLSFEDSVAGGQTDIEMKVTVTEQPSGNTYERIIFVHLDLERPESITPVVTTNAARGSAFVQWNAVAGNSSAYGGAFQNRVYEYQVKYESYAGTCSLDDNESVFDTATAVVPLTLLAAADPSLNGDAFVNPKAAGEAQSYLFHLKKRQNGAKTVTADIHQDGDKYCFAVRATGAVYAQDGTVLATNHAPVLSTNVVDKGVVQLTQDTLITASAGSHGGGAMRYIGDLNGDGITDFVFSDSTLQTVSIFISSVGAAPTKVTLVKPADAGASFGQYVTSGGNFDGDANGYLDLIVTDASRNLHIYWGTAGSISTTRGQLIPGTTFSANISDIDMIGDFNGDGIDDVAVGEGTHNSNTGRVDILLGSTSEADRATIDVSFYGAASGDLFGVGVRKAGDLNGDGYGDFVVGGNPTPTKVKVFYGNATLPGGGAVTYDFTVSGINAIRKSFFGNINGDAYDDLAIVYTDIIYIYKGSASGVVVPGTWTEGVNRITHSAILTEALGNEGTNGTLAKNCTGQMRDIDGDGNDDIFLTGAYSQYLLSGTGSFLTLHPSVYVNKQITSATGNALVVENGLVICDRNNDRGDCVFYRE